MSEYSSIVAGDRRFNQVKLFNLNEEQFDCMKFSAPKNVDYLTCIAIDQSEDLLLRFIQSTGDEHMVQSTDNTLEVDHNNAFNNGSDIQIEVTSNHNGTTLKHNGASDPPLENLMIDQQEKIVYEISVFRNTEIFSFCKNSFVINDDSRQSSIALVQLKDRRDHIRFNNIIQEYKKQHQQSTFRQRTDFASASQYFQFYGYLSQQQNMMQDYIRTSTYQKAIHSNSENFKDKVVLDVGAGSGILSFFALQAGARKVYAVEASSMAKHAQLLVQSNGISGRIEVIAGKIEEVDLPEPVDIIISEPMGYMLFNERMLETYLHAKKWLRSKEEGRMFPSRGDLHIAPFTDAQLYIEQTNKANFWFSKDFHGIDLRALHSAATDEYFKQPIVDTFDSRICMAKTVRHIIDFQKAHETDLHCINIPLEYVANQTGHIHGLAFWFDVAFIGSSQTVWLSTAPSQPLTHWYQVRCLLTTPLFVNKGQNICGNCILKANKRQSYDVDIELYVKELGTRSSNTLDLKNPYFRYTGQPTPAPPGTTEISPSEQLWSTTVYDPYQPVVNPTIIQSNPQQQNNTISQQALQQIQAIATTHPGYPGQIRLLTSGTPQPCNNNQVGMNDFNGVQ